MFEVAGETFGRVNVYGIFEMLFHLLIYPRGYPLAFSGLPQFARQHDYGQHIM